MMMKWMPVSGELMAEDNDDNDDNDEEDEEDDDEEEDACEWWVDGRGGPDIDKDPAPLSL